jgi:hypothetical protein
MHPLHQDVLSTLGFVMLHVKHTWSSVLTIISSWMEQSMPISLNEQVGLLTSMLRLYKMRELQAQEASSPYCHAYQGARLHYERSGVLAGKI